MQLASHANGLIFISISWQGVLEFRVGWVAGFGWHIIALLGGDFCLTAFGASTPGKLCSYYSSAYGAVFSLWGLTSVTLMAMIPFAFYFV